MGVVAAGEDRVTAARGGRPVGVAAGRRARWRSRASAAVATGLLAAALCPYCSATGWPVDLAADLSAQFGLLTIPIGAWWAIRRGWRCAGAAGVALLLHGAALAAGRAAWATGAANVRVLQYNAGTSVIGEYTAERRLVLESGADVVSLVESMGQIPEGDSADARMVRERYPYLAQNPKGEIWFAWWILSRWPMEDFPLTEDEGAVAHPLAVVVHRPGGDFGMVVLQADSPRTATRWIKGNLLTDMVGPIVKRMRERGLPVVLCADLNSGPAGYRARELRRAGLGRGKPMGRANGTYPSGWPWPAQVAIDDVWGSGDVRVQGWRTIGPGGSDHMAVVADLAVPDGP